MIGFGDDDVFSNLWGGSVGGWAYRACLVCREGAGACGYDGGSLGYYGAYRGRGAGKYNRVVGCAA